MSSRRQVRTQNGDKLRRKLKKPNEGGLKSRNKKMIGSPEKFKNMKRKKGE